MISKQYLHPIHPLLGHEFDHEIKSWIHVSTAAIIWPSTVCSEQIRWIASCSISCFIYIAEGAFSLDISEFASEEQLHQIS